MNNAKTRILQDTLKTVEMARRDLSHHEIECRIRDVQKNLNTPQAENDNSFRVILERANGILLSYSLRNPSDRQERVLENNFNDFKCLAESALAKNS